jgi:protein-S-isoprenylcysteine O-methyltransferase Ste14
MCSGGREVEVARGSRGSAARILEIVILLGAPVLCHYVVPVRIVVRRPCSYLGVIPMVLGLILATRAAAEFRRAGTGFALRGGSSALVTSGPFRFSRNPMYLAMLTWLLGLAVLLGSLVAFVFPVLFWLLASLLVIPLEERRTERLVGERFLEYKRDVRRWL